MEGGNEMSLRLFLADQKIASSWKKNKTTKTNVLGHPIVRATSYCLLPDTFCLRVSKNAFKVGKITVTAFHCEESTHRKYKQPKDLSDAGRKSKVLTTPPESPSGVVFQYIALYGVRIVMHVIGIKSKEKRKREHKYCMCACIPPPPPPLLFLIFNLELRFDL